MSFFRSFSRFLLGVTHREGYELYLAGDFAAANLVRDCISQAVKTQSFPAHVNLRAATQSPRIEIELREKQTDTCSHESLPRIILSDLTSLSTKNSDHIMSFAVLNFDTDPVRSFFQTFIGSKFRTDIASTEQHALIKAGNRNWAGIDSSSYTEEGFFYEAGQVICVCPLSTFLAAFHMTKDQLNETITAARVGRLHTLRPVFNGRLGVFLTELASS